MSGPIVRTGTTPKFWENYDKVFGKAKVATKTGSAKSGSAKAQAKKKPAKKK